jgi:hypothetical protein
MGDQADLTGHILSSQLTNPLLGVHPISFRGMAVAYLSFETVMISESALRPAAARINEQQ